MESLEMAATEENDSQSRGILFASKDECIYTKCFCEENVWKMCESIRKRIPSELEKCYAVVLSNPNRTIPLWEQIASDDPEDPVVWDYHVIFLHVTDGDGSHVYDLDTRLSFPTSVATYVDKAFLHEDRRLATKYHRYFRVIPAEVYLEKFASDRSHMRTSSGEWQQPPPEYPCIKTDDCNHNLDDFISMEKSVGCGDVYSYTEFVAHFLPDR
ncbi:protein N-terminal glutamine amidohydrolase-like [Tubulanus polymorphus]|uniref:protein N-terminal glutamine amidohydrolase-like n=1 Tax=Tubulanus polymorphus TaxID=672921 RepID=UPI003DA44C39